MCAWSSDAWQVISGPAPDYQYGAGPDAAANGTYYVLLEGDGMPGKAFALTSTFFNVTFDILLTFQYHMYTMFETRIGSLELQYWTEAGKWLPLWHKSDSQHGNWIKDTMVLVPSAARRIRFLGTPGNSWKSDNVMALDGISAVFRDSSEKTPLEAVSCSFDYTLCGWSTNDSTWRQIEITFSTEAGLEKSVALLLISTLNNSADNVLLSPRFFSEVRLFRFSYFMIMDGDDVGSLEVQYWTTYDDGWLPLWARYGHQGRGWLQGNTFLPNGTEQLRFVGTRASASSYIALDSFEFAKVLSPTFEDGTLHPQIEQLSCDFESSDCWQWFGGWMRGSNATINTMTGPTAAAQGDFYVYVESLRVFESKESWLATPVFTLSEPTFLSFYYMYETMGFDKGRFELQFWNFDGWHTLWLLSEGQGRNWLHAARILPMDAMRLRFLFIRGAEDVRFSVDVALDDLVVGTGLAPTIQVVDCTPNIYCGWILHMTIMSDGSLSQEDNVLLSPLFQALSTTAVLQFRYLMDGDNVTSFELQYWTTSDEEWLPLWSRSGHQSTGWLWGSVVLPIGTEQLRFVGYSTLSGGPKFSSVETGELLSTIVGLSCDFESPCSWSTGSNWRTRSGAGFLKPYGHETGPDGAVQGIQYLYLLAWSDDMLNAGKEFALTSAFFNASDKVFLSFYYHMLGQDMGSLDLQYWSAPDGWHSFWSKSGSQGEDWLEAKLAVPPNSQRLRFVGTLGQGMKSDMAIDNITAYTGTAPDIDFILCRTEVRSHSKLDMCGWLSNDSGWQWVEGSSFLWLTDTNSTNPSVLLSPRFRSLFTTVLQFACLMDGDIGSLELHVWSASDEDWLPAWSRFGDQGSSWLIGYAVVPAGAEQLRFVGRKGSGSGEIVLDYIQAGGSIASVEELACDFELASLCGWSSPGSDWRQDSGGSPYAGQPAGAAEGAHYIYVSGYLGLHHYLSSRIFVLQEDKLFSFQYHMLGLKKNSLELLCATADGYHSLWFRSGEHSYHWRSVTVVVPSNAVHLLFLARTELTGAPYFEVALDAFSFSPHFTSPNIVSCDFSLDTCGWSILGPWQRISGGESASIHKTEQISSYMYINANETGEGLILRSHDFVPLPSSKALHFAHRLTGEAWLELQCFILDAWVVLWSGVDEMPWTHNIVEVPAFARSLRFVFNHTGAPSHAGIGEIMAFETASTNLSRIHPAICSFELECLWTSVKDFTWLPTLHAADQWNFYMILNGSSTNSQSHEVLIVSPLFEASSFAMYFAFEYHVDGKDDEHLELQGWTEASGWTLLWNRSNRHLGWTHPIVWVPRFTRAFRFVGHFGRSVVGFDSFSIVSAINDTDALSCDFEKDFCDWSMGGDFAWTGPSEGYAHVDTSDHAAAPGVVGMRKEFVLVSPMFPERPSTQSWRYLSFAYEMSSGNVFSLELQSWSSSLSFWLTIWGLKGQQGVGWHNAKVRIPENAGCLRFVGVTDGNEWGGGFGAILMSISNLFSFEVPAREFATISVGSAHACLLYHDSGELRCFGYNDMGQLGQGHRSSIGNEPGEIASLLPVDLGENMSAKQITAGGYHTCALLQDDSVKCFGWGVRGQLGSGWFTPVGDSSGDMGASLRPIDLGDGMLATQVAAGRMHTCVLLQNHAVKCFGENEHGELGQGHRQNIGWFVGQMGANLPSIDLGDGMWAKQIAPGDKFTCVLLQDNSVKCFGLNSAGHLGQGSFEGQNRSIGDEVGEMGSNLPAVDLGIGVLATQIATGGHACALLQDNSVKCFGSNYFGQLGQGHTLDIGDHPGELGANLPPIDLGTGMRAKQIAVGALHTCVLLQDSSVKCFGYGAYGQLGKGNTQNIGDEPGEMGDNLPAIDFGEGEGSLAVSIAAGGHNTCVLFQDDSMKCFGLNSEGEAGMGHDRMIGDDSCEMSSLAPVQLAPLTPRQIDELRLSEGALRGRVEVLHAGVWGTICDDRWSDANAQVA